MGRSFKQPNFKASKIPRLGGPNTNSLPNTEYHIQIFVAVIRDVVCVGMRSLDKYILIHGWTIQDQINPSLVDHALVRES